MVGCLVGCLAGPSQCTSCQTENVLVGWRPVTAVTGETDEVSFAGACRRYDVLGNGKHTMSADHSTGHANWREGHAKADGTITQVQHPSLHTAVCISVPLPH